jgi:hypothetical protein
MHPVEILRQADGMPLRDKDGRLGVLRLLPPLDTAGIAALEQSCGRPVPPQLRELLLLTRGLEGLMEGVDFGGCADGQVLEDVFPHAIPVALDGYGNSWVLDLAGADEVRLDVWFLCHDPPVAVFQTGDLAHFLQEMLKLGTPPHASELDVVHEQAAMRIWREDPGLIPVEAARDAADPKLRAFARDLPDGMRLCDLRAARTGDGFAWGRGGPNAALRPHGDLRLFACAPPRPSFWRRLFG